MTEPKQTSDAEDQELQGDEAQDIEAEEAGKEEVTGEEAPEEKEKTYTQADIDRMEEAVAAEKRRYAGLDTKLTETTKQSKARIKELEDALVRMEEAVETARNASFLRKVEEEGGDVDMAKAILKRDSESKKRERDLDALEKGLREQETILNEAGRGKKAADLVKQYELEPDVVDNLLECETPEKMEIRARDLYIEKLKTNAQSVIEPDKNKNGRISTEGLSIEERLGLAAEGRI